MENGRTRPITARSGCRRNPTVGFHIAMSTGFGNPTTVGPGLALSLGVGRHITTVAGCGMAARGHGGRDRCGAASIVRCGRRLLWRSFGLGAGWGSASAGEVGAVLAGCPSGRVIASFHGGADTAGASVLSASTDLER